MKTPREEFKPGAWYWVRRTDGSLAPYRLHRVRRDAKAGQWLADVFVGSFIQSFPLSQIVSEAMMPDTSDEPDE